MSQFTDSNDFEISLFKQYNLGACNWFSWSYVSNNPNAVVRVGETTTGNIHCFVYDPALNLTIDPTLSQFNGLEDGYWEGDEHPHMAEVWETWESDEKESFDNEYDAPGSPFII